MFILSILILLSAVNSRAPFIETDTVFQPASEFQVNLILNQNRHLIVAIVTHYPTEPKETQEWQNTLIDTLQREPNITIGLLINCRKYQKNLKGQIGFCRQGQEEGTFITAFYPRAITLELKGHQILGAHLTDYLSGSTEPSILAKKFKQLIPNFVIEIEDDYDLKQFLKDKTMAKVIYFEQALLNPLYLQKLSSRFHRRVDIGVCDNIQIAKKYNVSFQNLILLDYNYRTDTFEVKVYSGSTDFEDNPFNKIYQFLQQHVLPNKSRDLLLDFQLIQTSYVNISNDKLLQKLVKQDKMVIVQINRNFKCQKLQRIKQREQALFNYACFNPGTSQLFPDLNDETLFMFNHQINEKIQIQESTKIEEVLKFEEIKQKVSSEEQSNLCLAAAATNDKFPVYSYYNSKSYPDFLIRYFNSIQSIRNLFYFCQVYMPDRFIAKRLELKHNTTSTFIKDNKSPDGYRKIQHGNIKNFLDLKMFLRDIAITKLTNLYDEALQKQIQNIYNPDSMYRNCFSKPCIIGLINKKKNRAEAEIKILKSFEIEFKNQFNFVWIDGNVHKQIVNQLKLKQDNLSALFYYHEKSNKYLLYKGGKYWIKKDIQKWLKEIRAGAKLSKLKYSLDIQPKNTLSNQL